MRWSEAVTLEFVKIYRKHECLWNPAHAGYKLKYEREKAYDEICTEFKASTLKSLSIAEVRMKIKNLRTTYAQQVHKILQKSSPDCIYEPSLAWFHEMDQCLKHISSNRHPSSYSQESSDINSNPMWVENELQNNNEEESNDLILQTDDEYDITIPVSKIKLEGESPVAKRHQKKTKKRKLRHQKFMKDYSTDSSTESQQDPIDDSSEVWVSQPNNIAISIDPIEDAEDYNIIPKVEPINSYDHDNSSHCKVKKKKMQLRSPSVEFSDRTFRGSMDSSDLTKEDEFEIYGKYIASQLRRMDLQKALRVQLEIQSLVSEARISDLTNKH